jgi:hypothetical protein
VTRAYLREGAEDRLGGERTEEGGQSRRKSCPDLEQMDCAT